MDLNEKLSEDQKSAMKGGDTLRISVLRLLRTRIKERAVEKRGDLSDDEIYKVIMSEAKKRQEAIELFEQGGRADLADREKQEIEFLKTYLPPMLSDDEVKALILEAIKEVEAKTPQDLGKVMKVLMPKVTGRTEGSKVNKIVKELLTPKKD
ncbi:MAG: GatB/YqeY domain-containing protein [Candidatus Eisenbacteria bacterium]